MEFGEPEYARGSNHYLVSLPRGGERVFTLRCGIARGVAGCVICHRPIPKGLSRLEFRVRLAEPEPMPDGRMRRVETGYAHVGCVTEVIRPEVVRKSTSCWDCGATAPVSDGLVVEQVRFSARCYTTSRFAHGFLCPKCECKPWWTACAVCRVHYPVHLVSRAVELPLPSVGEIFDVDALERAMERSGAVARGKVWYCEFCTEHYRVRTEASVAREKAERVALRSDWETRRAEIEREGEL